MSESVPSNVESFDAGKVDRSLYHSRLAGDGDGQRKWGCRRLLLWLLGASASLLIGLAIVVIALAVAFSDQPTEPPPEAAASPAAEQAPSRQAAATATPTWEERRAQIPTIGYRELFRNNEQYIRQRFYFRGKIVQVIERGENTYDFRVDVEPESLSSAIVYLAEYTGRRLLEDDRIEFVGTAAGLERYESISGQSITIPRVKAVAVRWFGERGSATAAVITPLAATPTPTSARTLPPQPTVQGSDSVAIYAKQCEAVAERIAQDARNDTTWEELRTTALAATNHLHSLEPPAVLREHYTAWLGFFSAVEYIARQQPLDGPLPDDVSVLMMTDTVALQAIAELIRTEAVMPRHIKAELAAANCLLTTWQPG